MRFSKPLRRFIKDLINLLVFNEISKALMNFCPKLIVLIMSPPQMCNIHYKYKAIKTKRVHLTSIRNVEKIILLEL